MYGYNIIAKELVMCKIQDKHQLLSDAPFKKKKALTREDKQSTSSVELTKQNS